MIPGEIIALEGDIQINAGRNTRTLAVSNRGDRPIQVGSHYHFFEVNRALQFERALARGMRLNIAAGTAVRFEPGQIRTIELVDYAGDRIAIGFQAEVMGALDRGSAAKIASRKAAPTRTAKGKPSAKSVQSRSDAGRSTARKSTAKKGGRA